MSLEASTSAEPRPTLESPGAQTLASLEKEPLRDRQYKRGQIKTPAKPQVLAAEYPDPESS